MKKLPVVLALIALAIAAYAMTYSSKTKNTVSASSTISTEVRNVDDFDKLEIDGGAFEVDVTYSSTEEVVVEAPENLQEYIELNVKGGTLEVEIAKRTQIKSSCALKIHIKTAKLNGFELAGASSVRLNNPLKDNSLSIESSGAASFKGEVEVTEAEIELDGAATVNLTGTASDAHIELSGASQVNDYSFAVDNLHVELSGASSVRITSPKRIEGDLSGASSLNYAGSPTVKSVSVSGASRMNKR